ncbi:MAG: CofH family radical SAM protein [Euryarchaeota archaeon]|nr:CofH family radical SAM protein [Euryarchaeota archaeon]MBT3757474.1 CofH family radical SAM protein [Euryarchaeota archaeon]MBT4050566.1 CofH family radical SAM protein [Euryarchaeota archaeon]MBT4650699.1 CofH family radical SAM protein [Euryarchaeota archaeon]MBT4961660.1 CofH family radical SAM protein [Euryarchaeota archaeon]
MSSVAEILEKKLFDFRYRLSVDEATLLYDKCDLNDLMYASLEVRKSINPGNKITYLVDRNINYTNACTINCQFCSFYRPPRHKEVYTQSYEEISTRISELEKIGGTRILMQGGVNPELSLDWYLELIKYLRDNHPSIALDCFSPIEIEGIAEVCDLSTLKVLKKLAKAGMHGLPGGGAEILVDTIRNDISPKKGSASNWLKVMGEAQEIGLTTSATNVFGFGETNLDRVMHMEQIRILQDNAIQNGKIGFTSFIAWPVQLENNSFGRRNRGQNRIELGATAQEYLRHIAISRLFFDNIDHIQASWPTMGLGVAQMAMLAGADDAGSTMMEENVVSASGTKKTEALETEIQNSIIRAGFLPQKRDSDYKYLSTNVVTTVNSYSPIPQQF